MADHELSQPGCTCASRKWGDPLCARVRNPEAALLTLPPGAATLPAGYRG